MAEERDYTAQRITRILHAGDLEERFEVQTYDTEPHDTETKRTLYLSVQDESKFGGQRYVGKVVLRTGQEKHYDVDRLKRLALGGKIYENFEVYLGGDVHRRREILHEPDDEFYDSGPRLARMIIEDVTEDGGE